MLRLAPVAAHEGWTVSNGHLQMEGLRNIVAFGNGQ